MAYPYGINGTLDYTSLWLFPYPFPGPLPVPLVQHLASGEPCGIAVDDNYVYWTEGCACESIEPDGKIWKVPINGGDSEIIADNLDHPAKITVYNGNVYWTEWGGSQLVRKMSVNGGTIYDIGYNIMDHKHLHP